MEYKQIHIALKDKGLSWATVGSALDCSYQHVMNVCARRADSARVAKAVSVLIDKDVSEVFPDKPQYKKSEPKKLDTQTTKSILIEAGLAEAS